MRSNQIYISAIILVLAVTSCKLSRTKDSFKLLDKASTLIEKGKYTKALKKIKKAERSDFCIYGNCVLLVNEKANLLRHFIYFESREYTLAQQSLDNIMYHSAKTDSLKVITYQFQYGKDFLSKQIDVSLTKSQIYNSDFFCYLEIPLNNTGNSMLFKMDHAIPTELQTDDNRTKNIKKFRKKFIESPNYKMIRASSYYEN